jgi:hypothetical protein
MDISIDNIEVVTRYYQHPREGEVYINPVTGEEFTTRKIYIVGHLGKNIFPFWITSAIGYPSAPANYPDCKTAYYTCAMVSPGSATFRIIAEAFDDMSYEAGKPGFEEKFEVPMEGLYRINCQASWLPFGFLLPASEPVEFEVDTTGREDRRDVLNYSPPNIYTEA